MSLWTQAPDLQTIEKKKKKKQKCGDCTTVATEPRQLHYSNNLSEKIRKKKRHLKQRGSITVLRERINECGFPRWLRCLFYICFLVSCILHVIGYMPYPLLPIVFKLKFNKKVEEKKKFIR